MAAGRARRAAREAMRREFMMAGGPIDVYSRLRRTGAPGAVDKREKAFQRSGSSLPSLAITCEPAESSRPRTAKRGELSC